MPNMTLNLKYKDHSFQKKEQESDTNSFSIKHVIRNLVIRKHVTGNLRRKIMFLMFGKKDTNCSPQLIILSPL